MGVVIIDGSTVISFVDDEAQFKKKRRRSFFLPDLNNDNILSRSELRHTFKSLCLIETHFGVDVAMPPEELMKLYYSIFNKFDCDQSEKMDTEDFRTEMKKIMLAIADGLEFNPIQVALQDDDKNFLKQATDLEASKIFL